MAIYSFSVSVASRAKGQSSVASASYISGEKMTDQRTGENHFYKRHDVVDLGTTLPGNKKIETSMLWNQAEAADKRINSRTARKIVVALPVELSKKDHSQIMNNFRNFLQHEYGAAVTACIHYDKAGNPHGHMQMTTRAWDEKGPGQKIRTLDGSHSQRKEAAEKMRSTWAQLLNERLAHAGHALVDHRSYKRQGVDKVPTKHMGPAAAAMERKGVRTEIGDFNHAAKNMNDALAEVTAVEKEKQIIKPMGLAERIKKAREEGVFDLSNRAPLMTSNSYSNHSNNGPSYNGPKM